MGEHPIQGSVYENRKLFSSCSKLAISLVDRKTYVTGQKENKVKMEILCKWHGNGPFVLTDHMVQNPPYWMTKECSKFEHTGIPTCQA